jgi:exonuclease VII small subunit
MATARNTDKVGSDGPMGADDISGLSYSVAGAELDAIIEEFETGVIDVDRLVEQLERATLIVDELDRRLRRTRMRVEELVPRLEAIGQKDVSVEAVEIDEIDEIEIEFEEDYDDSPSDEDRPPGLF